MMSKTGSGEFVTKTAAEETGPCLADQAGPMGDSIISPASSTPSVGGVRTWGSSAVGVGRGHMRSASHGGVVASGLTSSGSTGLVSRPSALKSSRGHQRAFSQGQIEGTTESSGFQRGHTRVGSKTDFILPPGHRETDSSESRTGAAGSARAGRGHSRQASQSESIYTLRNNVGVPWNRRIVNFILRRTEKSESERRSCRTVVPNHIVPPKTPAKIHPNGKRVNNSVRTTKYTFLSFLPKNLLEQFHRVANLYFIFIILLNWFPGINAFGKEVAMIPVTFVLGVTAIKDLFEDRRRRASDKRINNSTCRVYVSEAQSYRKVLWKDVRVGDLVHLSNNEVIPADILLLRCSDPNGVCYIDTCNLDGETNLKPRQVVRGFADKHHTFKPSLFRSKVEVDPPTTKMYRFHGTVIHPDGKRVPIGTENLLLRECMLKNTDFVEGLVVYAGHETKAMLNNGGPRYKRSKVERQMNTDIIWCVVILLVLCVVGAIGCRFWHSSYEAIISQEYVPFFVDMKNSSVKEGFLAFFTFIIILQVMIPLSLYVTIEMTKLAQVHYIHHNVELYDPLTDKRIECRALNITEELGQVQYIFSDKTGTLTENKMLFRRCTVGGVDYNHPSPDNVELKPGEPIPVQPNHRLQAELAQLDGRASPSPGELANQDESSDAGTGALLPKTIHPQRLQEFLLVLAVCNTVVVSRHEHHDIMNASGVIEENPVSNISSIFDASASIVAEPISEEHSPAATIRSAGPLGSRTLGSTQKESVKLLFQPQDLDSSTASSNVTANPMPTTISSDKYTRLTESRSVTPSPPPSLPVTSTPQLIPTLTPSSHMKCTSLPDPIDTSLKSMSCTKTSSSVPNHYPSPVPMRKEKKRMGIRPKLLNVPPFITISGNRRGSSAPALSQGRNTPTPSDYKPIYEAESPDEIALVDAAYCYNCKLLRKTGHHATVLVPGEGVLEYELLQVLPFDSSRKCMSVILRHPNTREIILYCKGADSTILTLLLTSDDAESQNMRTKTEQFLNSYARQGLRVLVMAKRTLTEQQYADWARTKAEIEILHDHRDRERRMRTLYEEMENNLTLLGATGIEDRLQEGVPETIAALLKAGIVIWVLTGDKPETAINVAYSARLFSTEMDLLKISARSKEAAESTIRYYLADIERDSPPVPVSPALLSGAPSLMRVNTRRKPNETIDQPAPAPPLNNPGHSHNIPPSAGIRMNRKWALVVDGKSLTYILDRRSKLQKPFLELTRHCSSVLCCRATPLQKAYIVRIVKEQLKMRTLAIGDGANDVSMIQTADVGVGISGQEGMQAVMASDFALSRFKYLERFLLVHGHWCYHRLSLMILYFFYKNATFVFLIFWYQLYCGFSGQIMLDQMFLMLFNLLYSSLPPLAVGIYDQDAPEELLLSQPHLYRQGRLGRVYQPHSFWVAIADCLYQSIVIFFVAKGAYHDSDVGLWEFGTTITTSCMFIMLLQIAIEYKSWTVIHMAAIVTSLGLYFVLTLLYSSFCEQFLGMTNYYKVMEHTLSSLLPWCIILLSIVAALLPRLVMRSLEMSLFPGDVTRALLDWRRAQRRGEDILVSWSQSASISSVFRSSVDPATKCAYANSLTTVG